jgi:zona occludens toxin (predicted ATPase)
MKVAGALQDERLSMIKRALVTKSNPFSINALCLIDLVIEVMADWYQTADSLGNGLTIW